MNDAAATKSDIKDVKEQIANLTESVVAGFENDVKELYGMAAETRKKFGSQVKKFPDLDVRLQRVERFVKAAARKTGISFPG